MKYFNTTNVAGLLMVSVEGVQVSEQLQMMMQALRSNGSIWKKASFIHILSPFY